MSMGKRRHFKGYLGIGAENIAFAISLLLGAYLMSVVVVFPPFSWLGWITLFPLFVTIRVSTPFRAMACGAFWGMSLFVFLTIPSEPVITITPFSCILLTLIPAIYAFLGSTLTRWLGFSPFILAVGWMAVEFALSPMGFRHGLLASAQGDGWLMLVVGQTFGYTFVAFIAAYFCACLVTALDKVCSCSSSRRYPSQGNKKNTIAYIQEFVYIPLTNICNAHPRAPPIYTQKRYIDLFFVSKIL